MKPVLHHLPEDQLARVKELASRLGITAAELIRRALDRELASHSPPAPETPRMATAKSARKSTMSPAQLYLFEAAKTPGKVSEVKRIGLDHMILDDKFQSRTGLDKNYAHSELRPILEMAGDLEAAVLFKEYGSDRLFMANGFHRHWTYKAAGRPDMPCIVIDAGPDWERELRLYSASANLKFSKPPTKEDKLKALYMLFADPECWVWSDKDLGRRSGVTSTSVAVYRSRFSQETNTPIPHAIKRFQPDGNIFNWFPYRNPDNHVPRPRQHSQSKNHYRVVVGGKDVGFTAASREEAERKAKEIADGYRKTQASEQAARVSLWSVSLRNWFARRSVLCNVTISIGGQLLDSERAFISPCRESSAEQIGQAVAALVFAWKKAGFPAKDLVVACYLSDWNNHMTRTLVDNLSAPGLFQIHFLTPEEIVQRYAPQEGQEEQGEPEPDKA